MWGRKETRNIYTIDVSFCFFFIWVQACLRINCRLHNLRSHALYSQFSAFVPTSVPTSGYAGSRSYMTCLLRSSSLASQRSPGIASTICLLDGMQIKIMCVCSCIRERAYLCPTLCDPMDCSPPSSSVHGISQARILEWVAMSSSRESSRPRDRTRISCIGRQIHYHWATWEAQ